MNKRKIITIVSIVIICLGVAIVVYVIFNQKNCESYSYGKCPVGCMVSSSAKNTEDIGCYSKDHEKGWTE